jgi:hypothetical protein
VRARGTPVPVHLRAPPTEIPAVDVRLEGWAYLARSLTAPLPADRWGARADEVVDGPHAAGCDCVGCLGRIGRAPAGVRP